MPPTLAKTQDNKVFLADMRTRTKMRFFEINSFTTLITAMLLGFAGLTHGQSISPATKPLMDKLAAVQISVDSWQSLTAAQKAALQPLSAKWTALTEGQQRKWIAVSSNFEQFSPKDKETLHSRMTDWASLTAKQREQARINFAQTKTLTASDKQAKWESYKALPHETKQALANINVAPKPTGAATAAKPVAKDKLVATKQNADKATVR